MLCSECNQNLAVIFMTKMVNGKQETEGLCFNCAKKRGIDPLNNMLLQSGISEEELENLTGEMEDFLNSMQQEGDSMVADDKSFFGAFSKLFGGPEDGNTSYESKNSTVKVQEKKNSKKKKFLDTYGTNLTELAKNNKLDKIAGRNQEIERTIQILNRRTKNNPVLIGEPGVGKTAIAEALAQRIVEKKVPPKLFNHEIYQLDITAVVAGTQFRGQFESRMRSIIEEAKNAGNVILVIDELHMITGAGDAEGAMNAANILKPALSRGEIQVIGAATLKEYRKHIEKDTALERRFQPVMVEEPTQEETLEILQVLKPYYEEFHKVTIPKETLSAAVSMSERYIHDRFLPDKAIDLIDEASSRINLNNKPLAKLEILKAQLRGVQEEKESAVSADSIEDYQKAADLKTKECTLLAEIETLEKKIKKAIVTPEDLAGVVELWTKIPAKKVNETESEKLLNLETALHKRIIGQDKAVTTLANAIRRNRAGLRNRKRPASFIFVGPTGVGKTELVKALATELFSSENAIIRFDMSEFMEKHAVSKLIGAPPGYVGYDEAGQLTEKVRRNPYSVILFDEIEKAHADIFNILLQILDEGRLTDSQGKTVNFDNTVIILTSNAGTGATSTLGFNQTTESNEARIIEALKEYFKPEFLNRLDEILVFNELTKPEITQIVDLMTQEINSDMKHLHASIQLSDSAKEQLVTIGYDPKYGARPLRRAIQKNIENKIAEMLLKRENLNDKIIYVDFVNQEFTFTLKD
ncbi:MAG: AAA family ATPase [Clostridia bacterium]|nr:AAA family ATPase [Clostridia bacterium]